MDTLHTTLHAVRDAALIGCTSVEVTKSTGISNNKVTAALTRLLALGCVRREKSSGRFMHTRSRYRYWYVREVERLGTLADAPAGFTPLPATTLPPPPMPTVKPAAVRIPEPTGVTIRLAVSARGHVTVTPAQARKVYDQLRVIFGA